MNYLKIYCDLVNKRLKTPAFVEEKGVGQKHHIIPKSCENKIKIIDLLNNYTVGQTVNLTYSEHYIAHCLLVKIFEKIDFGAYQCMLAAYEGMNNREVQNPKKSIGNRKYDMYRKKYYRDFWNENRRKEMSERNIGDKNPSCKIENRNKISNSLMGHEVSEETREKLKEFFKYKKPIIIYNIDTNTTNKYVSVEDCIYNEKICKSILFKCLNFKYKYGGPYKNTMQLKRIVILTEENYNNNWLSDNKKDIILQWVKNCEMIRSKKHSGNNNGNYKKQWTEEQKKRISEKKKGIKQSKEVIQKRINTIKDNKSLKGKNNPMAIPIIIFDIDNNVFKTFGCCKDCANEYNMVSHSDIIGKCLNFKYKYGGPFKNAIKNKRIIILNDNLVKNKWLSDDKLEEIKKWIYK